MIVREEYERFIYTLPIRYPSILLSTLVIVPPGLDAARLNGLILFHQGVILCVLELLDFSQGVITSYGYEVTRLLTPLTPFDLPDATEYCRANYPHKEKLYWYDSWAHPDDPTLATTLPHHKHIHPNIKRNRIPAPHLSFAQPNLPFLIEEIEREFSPG